MLALPFPEVPAEHHAIVPPLAPLAWDRKIMESIRIRSSKERPPFLYRIQHRSHWFYIDDSDIDSKVYLEALVAAYSSRVGSKQATDESPQAVLPVGGG
jgi:hypothetical protein